MKVAAGDSWPCRCGPPLYRAPEILDATEASPAFDPLKLDVWALGVMLFLLLTGRTPWPMKFGINEASFQLVIHGKLQSLLNAWRVHLSSPAVETLQALLRGDPTVRPTVAEVRQLPWFVSGGH